jgi:glutamate-5-semialdehyde dehydrogenase
MSNVLNQTLKLAKKASRALQNFNQHTELIGLIAQKLIENQQQILNANQLDVQALKENNAKIDRLMLNPKRIEALAESLHDLVHLEKPMGKVFSTKTLENGLQIEKISVPFGVIGVIYESRPNVTIDVAALCLLSGNVAVLKGSSEAHQTNLALVQLIHQALETYGLPTETVTLLPANREATEFLLNANHDVDLIIPRGSQQLIEYVRSHSKIPVIETGAGVCHTYVHSEANISMAVNIVFNAKTSRPSVCNSLDTILIDRNISAAFSEQLAVVFQKEKVKILADEFSFEVLSNLSYPHLSKADTADFGREFLDLICSIKTVENLDEALEHIASFSSKHSEAIITENNEIAKRFLLEVDAAAVYHNASTRFTDGGCFGLGAEIGISTQKLHARGPFALEKLVTEKWIVRGNGQVRN